MSNENINNIIKNTSIENLYIIPASQDLSSIDMDLAEMEKRATRLKNIFKKNNITEINFDYIFMDCPPALNMLTVNSLALANFIIIPLQTEFFALEGLSQLMITIKQIRKTLNQELKILGILLTMYDRRNNLSLQIEEDVRSTLNDLVLVRKTKKNKGKFINYIQNYQTNKTKKISNPMEEFYKDLFKNINNKKYYKTNKYLTFNIMKKNNFFLN